MIPAPYTAVLAALGGVLCAGGLAALLFIDNYSAKIKARLRELPDGKGRKLPGNERLAQPAARAVDRNTGSTAKNGSTDDASRKRRQSQLIQAGIYSPSALFTFFVVRAALTLVPPLLALIAVASGLVSLRIAVLWGAPIGIAGMLLPSLWLESKVRSRHLILRQALADFLDLMIVCLQSGLSLQATIQCVSDELRIVHPEFAGELNIVQRDIDLGATVDNALRRFALRSGCEGVGALAKFVREAQRLGTQLTEALRVHADMLRTQREVAAEETAQKAAVKILLPTLLLILPAVFIVLAGPAVIQIQHVFAK